MDILMLITNNIRTLITFNEVITFIWDILTSDIAVMIYVIVFVIAMVLTILLLISNEEKRGDILDEVREQTRKAAAPIIEFVEPEEGTGGSSKEEKKKNNTSRFFMLNKIDELKTSLTETKEEVNLENICDEFRQFSANKLGLFYDIKDIRRFVGGLSVGHIMILQGMSGTGKTSLAYAFGEYLNNSATIVPIQPMWKERTDLIGYYNEFTKKFNETTLLQKLYEASQNNQIYIIVLDEMNIARVEYYFAEFLSLLEIPDKNKRYLDVVTDVWDTDPVLLQDGKIILPNNMWFVGTANNDDSTFAISDKVYDRAMVINLDRRANRFISKETNKRAVTSSKFEELVETAKLEYEISYRNLRRIKLLDNYLMEHFHITFGNRIMQQIINYVPVIVASGGTELDALDDIMSKKVLRKLETKNMVYVKNAAPGLISYIHELFGKEEMSQCIEYIQNVEINA